MNRVTGQRYAEAVAGALDLIPDPVAYRVGGVDVLAGVDPVFAGLHRFDECSFARSYRNTAHVVYPCHQRGPSSRRRTTLVLPTLVSLPVIVHELGHVLHELLRFKPSPAPVSWYAKTDPWEAFAEAFMSWVIPGYAKRPDGRTVALLDGLAEAW